MVYFKNMTDFIICHLEAFLQSMGTQLRPHHNSIRTFIF